MAPVGYMQNLSNDIETIEIESDSIDVNVSGCSTDISIRIDEIHNFIAGKNREIGVLFKYVPSHLRKHYGIRETLNQAIECMG